MHIFSKLVLAGVAAWVVAELWSVLWRIGVVLVPIMFIAMLFGSGLGARMDSLQGDG